MFLRTDFHKYPILAGLSVGAILLISAGWLFYNISWQYPVISVLFLLPLVLFAKAKWRYTSLIITLPLSMQLTFSVAEEFGSNALLFLYFIWPVSALLYALTYFLEDKGYQTILLILDVVLLGALIFSLATGL